MRDGMDDDEDEDEDEDDDEDGVTVATALAAGPVCTGLAGASPTVLPAPPVVAPAVAVAERVGKGAGSVHCEGLVCARPQLRLLL